MKLKVTVHGVAYEVEVEVLDPGEGFAAARLPRCPRSPQAPAQPAPAAPASAVRRPGGRSGPTGGPAARDLPHRGHRGGDQVPGRRQPCGRVRSSS